MSYFNEIFSSDGQVRSHYTGVIEHWQAMKPKDKRDLQLRSKKFFSGDYAQDPLPRVLTQNEFQLLSRGVEQRARAILGFLQDYCAKGVGVWIGQKESKKSLASLVEKLRADPQKYIIQEFEHLSVLVNRIVDLRLHAHVDAEQIIVSNTPWGRANWIHGNGKVNIGCNGFTSPVVVMRQ